MSVSEKMQSILEEADGESEMKMVLPQLVSAMMAIGLDPQDDDNQDHFIAMLKQVVMNIEPGAFDDPEMPSLIPLDQTLE